jgi:hypothetical protein
VSADMSELPSRGAKQNRQFPEVKVSISQDPRSIS